MCLHIVVHIGATSMLVSNVVNATVHTDIHHVQDTAWEQV